MNWAQKDLCKKTATVSKGPKMVFKAEYRLMQVKVLQNAPKGARDHSAILPTVI